MKKLTKEERLDIYLKLAEKIFKSNSCESFVCHLLWEVVNKKNISYFFSLKKNKQFGFTDKIQHDVLSLFPEFQMFEPISENEWSAWFEYDSERIYALLLCAEMCKSN